LYTNFKGLSTFAPVFPVGASG